MNPTVETLVVFPNPAPPELARTLDLAGYRWKAMGSADEATRNEPPEGWSGAVVMADTDPDNHRAVRFFSKKGFSDTKPHLYLSSNLEHNPHYAPLLKKSRAAAQTAERMKKKKRKDWTGRWTAAPNDEKKRKAKSNKKLKKRKKKKKKTGKN